MKVTVCPTCEMPGAKVIGNEVPGFVVASGETQYVQGPYSICECIGCGLLFKTRTLSPEAFTDYYAKADFRKWETKHFYPTERAVLRRLRTLPRHARILDFGCSSGRLLAPLVGAYECFGYEINKHARRKAQEKGITMLNRDDLAPEGCGTYDAVVMSDVFEHLRCPVEALATVTGQLKVRGILILVTGNGDAPVCRLDPAQFWYFRIIEHVVMLTRKHAEWLEGQLRLTLTQWHTLCHYDWNWPDAIGQSLRHFAYWQLRQGSKPMQTLLHYLPGAKKAERWPVAPRFCYSPDHVVAVFQKE